MTLETQPPKLRNRRRIAAIAAPAATAVAMAAVVVAAAVVSSHTAGPHAARGHATGTHATGARAGHRANEAAAPLAPPAGPPLLTRLGFTTPALGGGLNRPMGVSAANGTVYVSNTGADELTAVQDGETSVVTGAIGGSGDHGDGGSASAATLYRPGGTAVDASGTIFLADSGDNVVREITPDGIIHRIAGTGSAGFGHGNGSVATRTDLDNPEGVAVDSHGDVFIADTYNNRVMEVTPRGQILTVAGIGTSGYAGDNHLASLAELNQPTGVAVDAQGNLYIADAANNVIRRVDARTHIITTVAGDFAADRASDGLGGFSGDGGPATSAQLNDPQGVAVDGAGDLFIADTFNNAVREVTPDGTISTVVNAASAGGGIPTSGGETSGVAPALSKLSTPYQLSIDFSSDTLYIADTHNNAIAEVTNLAQPGSAAGPTAPAHHF